MDGSAVVEPSDILDFFTTILCASDAWRIAFPSRVPSTNTSTSPLSTSTSWGTSHTLALSVGVTSVVAATNVTVTFSPFHSLSRSSVSVSCPTVPCTSVRGLMDAVRPRTVRIWLTILHLPYTLADFAVG